MTTVAAISDTVGIGSLLVGLLVLVVGIPTAVLAVRQNRLLKDQALRSEINSVVIATTGRDARQAKENAGRAAHQTTPSNGSTVAGMIESVHATVDELRPVVAQAAEDARQARTDAAGSAALLGRFLRYADRIMREGNTDRAKLGLDPIDPFSFTDRDPPTS